jgi:1-pyrroline-5-carboxylate dehydrogenase
MWETIGKNMGNYKSYPRIVGETGGKDFVLAHKSADPDVVVTALLRGAFEFQGQKCSAASRAYIPSNIAEEVKRKLVAGVKSFTMGTVEDFSNFINAVIDEKSFNNIKRYIDNARKDPRAEIWVGGKCDSKEGWFVQPTVIEAKNPKYVTMCEEIFGPVLTVYIYPANSFEKTLELVDTTSPYALTGSVISSDRVAFDLASTRLRNAAGNFYINDKPTGAVVGQQPFGGARGSGTNDKAGSILNLYRWLSARTIKETFNPPTDYKYPFLEKDKSNRP